MSIESEAKIEEKQVRFYKAIEHLEKSIERLKNLIDKIDYRNIDIGEMNADLEVQIERLEQILF